MWEVFTTVAQNVGVSFENIILGVLLLGGLVFYAQDAKLGIILHFVAFSSAFILFYSLGLDYAIALTMVFIFLILLAFTLIPVNKTTQQGAVI